MNKLPLEEAIEVHNWLCDLYLRETEYNKERWLDFRTRFEYGLALIGWDTKELDTTILERALQEARDCLKEQRSANERAI